MDSFAEQLVQEQRFVAVLISISICIIVQAVGIVNMRTTEASEMATTRVARQFVLWQYFKLAAVQKKTPF